MKLLLVSLGLLSVGCSFYQSTTSDVKDEQFVKIYMQWGMHDEVNTFDETLVKDLIPGTIKIPFWFTKREQEIILTTVERFNYFSFPDTIKKLSDSFQEPDGGPQIIRIKVGNKEKTIWWYEPVEFFKYYPLLKEVQHLIINIIESKPEYKVLPPRKGGYI